MPPELRSRPRLRVAAPFAAAAVVLAVGACEDDPFQIKWSAAPDTVLLYSLARPELNLPSAFNFNNRRLVEVEAPTATGTWDLALDTEGEQLVFLPPGALNINSRARIAALPGMTFDEVQRAPQDTAAYVVEEAVPVSLNTVYVIQTSQSRDGFGRACVFFAKLEPLEIDVSAGTLRFVFDANPVCNDPRLVPPED